MAIAALLGVSSTAKGGTIVVDQLAPTIVPGGGWGQFVQGGGSAGIFDLTGAGGTLESNQPSPIGAAKVTTGASNSDRGEIGISADFGLASDILNNLVAGYSYYKVDNGPNAFAAPSLKLGIYSAVGTGDNYGQLVYEPSWNQPAAGSSLPPTGDWQTVSIGSGTGAGSDSGGGWWWTGGFEQSSGAGGPPIKSASEWASLFALDADFASARIVGINVGVGTYNQNQIGYFDNVVFGTDTESTTYNFQPVPEPSSLAIFGIGALGLVVGGIHRRNQKQSA
ncbi:PEP-CTERM sorting domain-containing protein [Rubripirellula lacrimiformis]|uniref:PEP-CTERM sorting domain-containing protein n=1 Tax=Rubripirellula lacrimiformis TaxID=1930273 RepID=UPI001C54EB93|nr:PEP-CTERM sorting domain-containing protein [Rubripirellula lacrimiformis]